MTVELHTLLMEAVRQVESRMCDEIDYAIAALASDADLRDEFERAIDHVADLAAQAELRRLLVRLDAESDQVGGTLRNINLHHSLDPIRTVATDIASGFL